MNIDKEIKKMSRMLDRMSSKVEKLEQDVSEKEAEMQKMLAAEKGQTSPKMKQTMKRMERQIFNKKERLQEMQLPMKAMESELEALKMLKDYPKLQANYSAIKSKIEAKRADIKQLKDEGKALQASLKRLTVLANKKTYDSKIQKLSAELNQVSIAKVALQEQETVLSQRSTTLSKELEDLNVQERGTASLVDGSKQQVVDLSASMKKEEQLIKESLASKKSPEDQSVIEAKSRLADLEQQKSISEQTVASSESKLIPMQKSVLAKKEEVRVVQNELACTRQDFEAATTKESNLTTSIQSEEEKQSALEQDLRALTSRASSNEESLKQENTKLEGLVKEFELIKEPLSVVTDPRALVRSASDSTPFLLLPARIETRFMTVKHIQKQGQVSVGPIHKLPNGYKIPAGRQPSVKTAPETRDGKEPQNGKETSNTRLESLVVNRLVRNSQRIEDKNELWVRIYPDVVAIHTHEEQLTQDEYDAGVTYWTVISDNASDPDPDAVALGAWRIVSNAYGPARAAWIVKQTKPDSGGVFPTLTLKADGWSEAPKSKVMPDRYVVRVYDTNGVHREILGSLIPDPLIVGMTPDDDVDNTFDQVDGQVEVPDNIKWLTSFEEAEKVGMGIRIPISAAEMTDGFSKMLVLGLKLTANKSESNALLEELIDNHHYKEGGMSLVPQGTPTNNTEDSKTGYNSFEIGAEESFATERLAPLFTESTGALDKSDGQQMAELLGINPEKLHHIRHAGGKDFSEAKAMNCALWPATMGYYLDQMLTPLVSPLFRKNTQDLFVDFVHGRGHISAFRVDNQPYGIMPTTAFSKLKFPASGKKYEKTLYNSVLYPLLRTWESLAEENVKHVGAPSANPEDNFLDMMGLHASSVQFHHRYAAGQFFMWNLFKYYQGSFGAAPAITLQDASVSPIFLGNLFTGTQLSSIIAPRVARLSYTEEQRLLDGPVIDELLFSEIRSIKDFENEDGLPATGMNYIDWLIVSDFAHVSGENFDNVPNIKPDTKPPRALLYLLLRHACLVEYLKTSIEMLTKAGVTIKEAAIEFELQNLTSIEGKNYSVEEKDEIKGIINTEVLFQFEDQIQEQVIQETANLEGKPEDVIRRIRAIRANELRTQMLEEQNTQIERLLEERLAVYQSEHVKWNFLVKPYEQVSGNKPMAEFIAIEMSKGKKSTAQLQKIKNALEVLRDMPTARLERCFAETLDICNYRLDSWLIGLANQRLREQMDAQRVDDRGVFLGSYAMITDLKPNVDFPGIAIEEILEDPQKPSLIRMPGDFQGEEFRGEIKDILYPDFVYLGSHPFTQLELSPARRRIENIPRVDPNNLGYIHAPSMTHAVTAAILRAGYQAHTDVTASDDTLAVNLTSDRVRKAMYYLEGIRNGQELAALLGYQFERILHDAFNALTGTFLDGYIFEIRAEYPLVAGGVVENPLGVTSIDKLEARNVLDGLSMIEDYNKGTLDLSAIVTNTTHLGLILDAVNTIANHMDAIGDLLTAESVYQVAQGNPERSGAVAKALGEGGFIPEPEITKTPRYGKTVTHRFGIQMDVTGGSAMLWGAAQSSRSSVEPTLNQWVANLLPAPANICFNVEYFDFPDVNGDEAKLTVKLNVNVLDLQPIDFLYLMTGQGEQGEAGEIKERIALHVKQNVALRDDRDVKILFMDRASFGPADYSLFEITPLVKNIANLIGNARAFTPEDFVLPSDSSTPTGGIDTSSLLTRVTALNSTAVAPAEGVQDIQTELDAAVTAAAALDFNALPAGADGILDNLRSALMKGARFNIQGAVPKSGHDLTETARDLLLQQADRVDKELERRRLKVNDILANLSTDEAKRAGELTTAAQTLLGRAFKIFPEFTYHNESDLFTSWDNNATLLTLGGEFAVDEWCQAASKVRPLLQTYQKVGMLSDVMTGNDSPAAEVAQLPVISPTDDRWVGIKLPAAYEVEEDNLSMVIQRPSGHITTGLQAGFLIDEWTEMIPDPEHTTGLAMHYDQPNTEAPQSLLLAVSPEVTGEWAWDDLMDTLCDTLDLAKTRAVEPDHFKESILGQILPTIYAPVSGNGTAPSLDFARNLAPVESGHIGPINIKDFIRNADQ